MAKRWKTRIKTFWREFLTLRSIPKLTSILHYNDTFEKRFCPNLSIRMSMDQSPLAICSQFLSSFDIHLKCCSTSPYILTARTWLRLTVGNLSTVSLAKNLKKRQFKCSTGHCPVNTVKFQKSESLKQKVNKHRLGLIVWSINNSVTPIF